MADPDFLSLQDVQAWQSIRFRPNEIPFGAAAESLKPGEKPLVKAQPGLTSSRWIVVNEVTNKVAVLTHAGIWRWRSEIETGNYVPDGCAAPEGIPETRIQNTPSHKCEFSYAFATTIDRAIWEHMEASPNKLTWYQVFENYIMSQESFNRSKRPRRLWQDGARSATDKYIVNAKVFIPRSKDDTRPIDTPYPVHHWLEPFTDEATRPSFIPNPERPKYYDLSNGILKNLEDTNNPNFDRNDLVWMTFKLGFIVSGDQWWPEIVPIELVRVGKVASQISVKGDATLFPGLDDDYTPLEVGGPIELIDEPVRGQKRKDRDFEETTPSPPKKRATSEDDMLIVDMDNLAVDAEGPAADTATNGKHKLRSKGLKERTSNRA